MYGGVGVALGTSSPNFVLTEFWEVRYSISASAGGMLL